jgi:hypothetical protein
LNSRVPLLPKGHAFASRSLELIILENTINKEYKSYTTPAALVEARSSVKGSIVNPIQSIFLTTNNQQPTNNKQQKTKNEKRKTTNKKNTQPTDQ